MRQGLLLMQARSSFTRALSLGYACGFIGLFFPLPVCFIIVLGTLLRSRSPSAGGPFPGHAPSPEAHQPIRLGLGGGPRHRPTRAGWGVHFLFFLFVLGCPRPESQDPARADPASAEGALSRKKKKPTNIFQCSKIRGKARRRARPFVLHIGLQAIASSS